MVDIKHPIRKLLSQELIDELQEEYEKKQKLKREANFQARLDAKLETERINASGHARIIITENPREPDSIIEAIKEDKKSFIEKVKTLTKARKAEEVIEEIIEEANVIYEEPTIEQVIEGKADIADKMRDIADELNGENLTIAYVCQQGWNDEFENLFPKKAIWQGQITQSFAEWLKETKNYG